MTLPRPSAVGCRQFVGREEGSGTVLVVAAVGVLLILSIAGLQVGTAASAAHRARAAADLSALAAASAIQAGQGDPCGRASDLASRNGARLVECAVAAGESVVVRVSIGVTLAWPGVPDSAEASARAGPATVAGSKP